MAENEKAHHAGDDVPLPSSWNEIDALAANITLTRDLMGALVLSGLMTIDQMKSVVEATDINLSTRHGSEGARRALRGTYGSRFFEDLERAMVQVVMCQPEGNA